MSKYRNIQHEVDAFQVTEDRYDRGNKDWPQWALEEYAKGTIFRDSGGTVVVNSIGSLIGLAVDEFVVRDISHTLRVFDSGKFSVTYELAEE